MQKRLWNHHGVRKLLITQTLLVPNTLVEDYPGAAERGSGGERDSQTKRRGDGGGGSTLLVPNTRNAPRGGMDRHSYPTEG